jgi:predicted O-methyltransferase YrrM
LEKEYQMDSKTLAEDAAFKAMESIDWPKDSSGGGAPVRMMRAFKNKNSLMLWPERVVMYNAVFGLRPKLALEVGTYMGGSAQIMVAAMDDAGVGKLFCVDPQTEGKIPDEVWARISHRATMVVGFSPTAIAEAGKVAGGPFDLALIDGNHSYEAVIVDTEATMPTLADKAHILFHDAFFHGVEKGIDELIRRYPNQLVDVGMVSTVPCPDTTQPGTVWGGIRHVVFHRR